MDLSCECDCDCESWASRVGYEYVADMSQISEYLIEHQLCELCYTKGCRAYRQRSDTNPWKNT